MNQKGFIGYLVFFIFIVIVLGGGVFYYMQKSKVTSIARSLTASSDGAIDGNYQVNSFYVTATTITWKIHQYQDLKIKYPSGWEAKTFDLGDGERVAFTNLDTKASLFFADVEESPIASCDEFLDNPLTNPGYSYTSETKPVTQIIPMQLKEFTARASFGGASAGGYSAQELRLCFEKNGKEYAMNLQEPGSGQDFASMKDVILILNSLEFISK